MSKDDPEWTGIDYTLSVEALQRALELLQPTDRVTCNTVGNLLVIRDGAHIGHINIRGYADMDKGDTLDLWTETDEADGPTA